MYGFGYLLVFSFCIALAFMACIIIGALHIKEICCDYMLDLDLRFIALLYTRVYVLGSLFIPAHETEIQRCVAF